MNINQLPNRTKPKFLREQKTEALLVFTRTTLEQYFKDLANNKTHIKIGIKEDDTIAYKNTRRYRKRYHL